MSIPVFSVDTIRAIEAEADAQGYAYATMMEDAGRVVAEYAVTLLAGVAGPRVTVLVGKGNNGGDGLVAARLLPELLPGVQVRAYLLDRRDGDPLVEAAQEKGVFLSYAEDDHDGRVIKHMTASADLFIDALFGIGGRLPIRDTAQRVLRYVRQSLNERASARRARPLLDATAPGQIERPSKQYVLAVDCPSGIDCDSGAADSVAINAGATVTFLAAKPGLFTFPAAGLVGTVLTAPLNLPERIDLSKRASVTVTDNETARDLLPARPLDGNKGTFGRLLLVAGSDDMPGAAGLAATAAYRAGAGLVDVATTPRAASVLQPHLLEAIWTPLTGDIDAALHARLPKAGAVVIGPGLGNTAQPVVERILAEIRAKFPTLRVVLDADGLNVLAALPDWPSLLPPETILTPHPGEMARLTGTTAADVQQDRLAVAKQAAADWNAVVVLKGAHTLVAAPDGSVAISPFKTDALAKGGTGDVLAGLIGALRMQKKLKAFDAARLGVYVHGLAGIIASETVGAGAGVLASDVIDALPNAFARILAG